MHNITPKKLLRIIVSVATIAMAVQVWMPERKFSIPRGVAISINLTAQAPEITATLNRTDQLLDADQQQAADWFAKHLHQIEPVK